MMSRQKSPYRVTTPGLRHAAMLLHVTEFRVFELAWHDWFGTPVREARLESAYMRYLIDGRLPCWVQHFVRSTLRLCDEAGFELPQPMCVSSRGWGLDLVLVGAAAILLALLNIPMRLF